MSATEDPIWEAHAMRGKRPATEERTPGQRGLLAEMHLAIHADGRWCKRFLRDAVGENCTGDCMVIAEVALSPLLAVEDQVADAITSKDADIDSLTRQVKNATDEYEALWRKVTSKDAEIARLREQLRSLYWFFQMMESGGSDGSDLDTAVYEDALAAATKLHEAFDLPDFPALTQPTGGDQTG